MAIYNQYPKVFVAGYPSQNTSNLAFNQGGYGDTYRSKLIYNYHKGASLDIKILPSSRYLGVFYWKEVNGGFEVLLVQKNAMSVQSNAPISVGDFISAGNELYILGNIPYDWYSAQTYPYAEGQGAEYEDGRAWYNIWYDATAYSLESSEAEYIIEDVKSRICNDSRTSDDTQCGLLTLNGIGYQGQQVSEQYTFCIQPDANNTSGEITFPNMYPFFTFDGGSFRFTSGVVRGDGIIRVYGKLDECNMMINTEGQLGLDVNSTEILLFQAQFSACCDYPMMISGERDYTPQIDKFGLLSSFATITPTRIEWQGFEKLNGYCCDGVSCGDDDLPLDWNKLGGDDEMVDLTCVCDALDMLNLNIQNGNTAIVGALEQKLGQLKTSIDNKELSVDVDLDTVVAKLQAIKESIDGINPEQDFDGIINKLQAIKQSIDDKSLVVSSTGIESKIQGLIGTLGGINFGGSALTTNLPALVTGIGGLTTLFTTMLPALFSAGSDLLNALIGLKQSSDLVSIKDEIGDLKDSLDGLSDALEDILTCDDDTLACILKSALNTSDEDCSQGLTDVINDKKIEPSADVNVTVTPSDNVSISKVQYLSNTEE